DAGALSGLAIMAINGTIGTWFYSTNSGSSWNALGAVSATSARLLANNAGTRLYLQTNANFNGDVPAAITFRAWDQTSGTNGGTADVTVNGGTTAFSTATAVALAHLLAINDAPVNTVPGAQITSEDTPRVFSSGNGNGVTVTDVDAASSAVRVTLTVTNGTLTLAGLAGLSFTVGDGTGDATMTFTGTLTNMNAALNGLSFAPTLNYNGPANLTVATNDQGATGIGGAMSDTDVIAITVTAVNDAPVITGTAPPLATVDVPYSYDANVADVDGPGQSWTLLPAHTCGGTINPSTGEFFFTPIGPAPPSSCVVAIQVCDGGTPNLCATQSATVTIGLDADGDGVGNGIDNCPTVANAGQEDADGDGVGNVCDICAGSDDHLDADADGVPNGCDVCAGSNDLLDADFDGVPNGCDVCAGSNDHLDADFDGVPDGCDICAGFDDHLDADADGVPNGCDICAGFDDDLDADADGVPNGCDVCAGFDDDLDTDGDGVPNGCDVCAGFDDDLDTDGDGIPNGCDVCPGFPDNADADADGVPNGCDICAGFPDQLDADLDGVPNGCDICAGSNDHLNADGDALPDGCDNCPLVTNDGQQNFDGDALGDVCDPDDDNDGLSDVAEGGLGTDPQDPDSDDDGVGDAADNCPTVFGQVGSICDADAGPAVIPGTLNSSCTCVPVTGCTQNLTLEFQTDANPGQITWEIRQQGTNNLVQSGGPLAAPSGIQTVNTCVPDGCYYLRVLDAGGDGILGGGYILRTAGSPGIRLIDDRNNFSTGSVSAIAANEGFCFPLGTTTKPIFTSCDKLDWVSGDYLVCDPVASVSAQYSGANAATSGYEFWIFNPNGGYSFRKFRSHTVSDGFAPADASRACHIKLNNWLAASWIPANVLMNVRVRTRIADVNGNWGPACRMKIDAVRAACPLTKLMDVSGSSQFSCNVTRTFATSSYIYARPVTGANKYQFRFRIDGEGFVTVRNSNNYICQLNWSVSPLQDGRTYQVEVRASKDNGVTWCIDVVSPVLGPPFTQWGDVCDLTIDNTPMGGGNENLLLEDGSAQRIQLYPNPNRGDQLHLTFEFPEDVVVSLSNHTVSVDIYDLFGKRVSARTIAVQPLGEGSGGFINTVLELNGELAGGMYMVNIVAGGQAFTERLVIQK
ncbi:MAG TPA: thrombospondin type 3 repeat-containing protein, partial [Flavobacteriales bacterium]|nr:thrombospondin type 3 repeat-containing protein [Flavobacteriales bacterium]